MQFRITDGVVLVLAIGASFLLPPEIWAGDAGRLLATFLGLLSASILPTISLIVGSMTTNSRSVKAVNDLQTELSTAMDALFALFGLIGVAVLALVAMAIPQPSFINSASLFSSGIEMAGQAVILASFSMILLKAGYLPAILRRCLAVRHTISVDEARQKTSDNAPKVGAVKGAFPTHPDFGKTVSLDELRNPSESKQ